MPQRVESKNHFMSEGQNDPENKEWADVEQGLDLWHRAPSAQTNPARWQLRGDWLNKRFAEKKAIRSRK